MKKTIVFTLTLLFISTVTLTTASAQEIVFESQSVYDGGLLAGWSRGNSNGLVEAGERIELKVTLENNGRNTADNIYGVLITEDKDVIIHNSVVHYGNIRAGSHSPPHLIPLQNFSQYTFKIEVKDDAIAHNVVFKLFVIDGNIGKTLWTLPITLSIVDSPRIHLELPDDLISEEAFGSNSTYFIFTAKHPTLIGISDAKIFYDKCIITLHIPEDTEPFMFPIQTRDDQAEEIGFDLLSQVVISVGNKVIRGAEKLLILTDILNFFADIGELLRLRDRDLKVEFDFSFDRGRSDTKVEYIVLLKNTRRSLKSIEITVEQKYRVDNLRDNFTATAENIRWNFKDSSAAPPTQPLPLSDYPPFQLLPSEIQQHLLYQFPFAETAKTSRVPGQTSLLPNYPNPFNPETWIPYQLTKDANVTLTISNIKGQVVQTLVLGHQAAGIYQNRSRAAYWDGKNTQGEPVASGVYFYTLKAGEFAATRKMLVRK